MKDLKKTYIKKYHYKKPKLISVLFSCFNIMSFLRKPTSIKLRRGKKFKGVITLKRHNFAKWKDVITPQGN